MSFRLVQKSVTLNDLERRYLSLNVKRGRCPLTTVGDVTMLARINQVSNGRL